MLGAFSAMCPKPFNSGPIFRARAQTHPSPIPIIYSFLFIQALDAAAFAQQEKALFEPSASAK